MGFLHKLWDETLAGPTPDSGLGKLRKFNSFSGRSDPPTPPIDIPVSRTITVLRPSDISVGSGSVPSSPATPSSPFSPTAPGGDVKRLTRRKSTSAALQWASHKSPTGYDWDCFECFGSLREEVTIFFWYEEMKWLREMSFCK